MLAVLFLLFSSHFSLLHSSCSDCVGFAISQIPNENTLESKILTGFNLSSSLVPDIWTCFRKCVNEECRCSSMNYKTEPESDGSHICELNFETKTSKPQSLVTAIGFLYIGIETMEHEAKFCSNKRCRNCCNTNPCLNNGICSYECNVIQNFKCTCTGLYEGRLCQKKIRKSCTEYKNFGFLTSGNYSIDPDGEGPESAFTVYCDMVYKEGIGVTVISHDSEDRILADGCEDFGCYTRKVNYYGASMSQLANLTAVSANCEQFIKFECSGSTIINAENKMASYWVSRDGQQMDYWGDVQPPNIGCVCGLTSSCTDPTKICNCYTHTATWDEDSGYLTDKNTLPVSEMVFGDLSVGGDVDEKGYHTLGKFRCFG